MDVRQPNREKLQPTAPTVQPVKKRKKSFPNGHWLLPFMAGIILSVFVVVAAFGIHYKQATGDSDVDTSKYQAVFMTNGQVYFGKLTEVSRFYSELSDVYYLQVQQSVQPAKTDDQNSQIALTKLGNELHGPTDQMHISRDQILFWENLKDDSTVVKAIKEYKAQ